MSRFLIEEKIYLLDKREIKKVYRSTAKESNTVYLSPTIESLAQPIFESMRVENWTLVQPAQDLEKKRKKEIDLLFSNLVQSNKIRAMYLKDQNKWVVTDKETYFRIYVQITPLEDRRKCGSIASPLEFLSDFVNEWHTDRTAGGKSGSKGKEKSESDD